jgi:uncharacterized protein YndB with AHSA1/START domain
MSIKHIESETDRVIIIVELHDIAPAQAFQYWIRPSLLITWWPQEVVNLQAKEGGEYHFSWPDTNGHLRGMFSTFEPGQALGFTWQWDHLTELPARFVAVQMQPSEGGTLMTLTHGMYTDSAAEQADRQSHIDGWTYFLGRLHTRTSNGYG